MLHEAGALDTGTVAPRVRYAIITCSCNALKSVQAKRMNLEFVRGQFPGLRGEWTFFDNAGGSQTLEAVIQRIDEYLRTSNVQHGASYQVSRVAGERVAAATASMATFLNAAHASEVVFGPSTSMLLRILATSLGRTLEAGDEIVVTNVDHEANIGPWTELDARGMRIRSWNLHPDTLDLHVEDLRKLITDKTRLVAVTHASNVLGRINPIREIADIVHDAGALLCADGVAYAPHRRIDVQAFDVDFYTSSLYKVYGPHQAVLYGRREHLERLPRFNHFFIDDVPYKFQPGNVNFELTYGMTGLFDYVEAFATVHDRADLAGNLAGQLDYFFESVAAHEEAITGRLLDYLSQKKNVRILGETESKQHRNVPTVSFVVDSRQSHTITAEVDKRKIAIRYGDFYARRMIDALGLGERNGVVRVSMVHYNTPDEVDRLIDALDSIL